MSTRASKHRGMEQLNLPILLLHGADTRVKKKICQTSLWLSKQRSVMSLILFLLTSCYKATPSFKSKKNPNQQNRTNKQKNPRTDWCFAICLPAGQVGFPWSLGGCMRNDFPSLAAAWRLRWQSILLPWGSKPGLGIFTHMSPFSACTFIYAWNHGQVLHSRWMWGFLGGGGGSWSMALHACQKAELLRGLGSTSVAN